MTRPLRVAFLTGTDGHSTRMVVEAVCRVPGIIPVALLVDTATVKSSRRAKNLLNNVRKNGAAYALRRLLDAVLEYLEDKAAGVVSASEVDQLLRQAFPHRLESFEELGQAFSFPVYRAG